MSETEFDSGEENIDESGRNPTQERIDSERDNARPADASWQGDERGETADAPPQGEEGQEPEPA